MMDSETLGAAISLTSAQAAAAKAEADRAAEIVAVLDPDWTLTVTGTKLNFTKEET